MFNIVFSCYNITTNPPPTNLTPDQLQKRQTNIGLCNANNAYFCNYIQDASTNFAAGDYAALTKTYCKPGVGAVVGSVAGGMSGVGIAAYVGLAIGAFLCACLAANQMLYMPAIMRILVFIITLTISFINPFAMAGIFLYFMCVLFLDLFRHYKGIYNMDQFIFPATLLPLRLRRPDDGMLIRILLAPFTYIEPNPADEGRADYLASIDQYLNNLQRGAKITDELLASANLKGLKESIAKGLRDPVEELTRMFVAKQEANSLQKDILQKPLNTSKVNRLVELGQLSANNAAKLVEKAGADVINSGYTQPIEKT
jgi:hypothetical protein